MGVGSVEYKRPEGFVDDIQPLVPQQLTPAEAAVVRGQPPLPLPT